MKVMHPIVICKNLPFWRKHTDQQFAVENHVAFQHMQMHCDCEFCDMEVLAVFSSELPPYLRMVQSNV